MDSNETYEKFCELVTTLIMTDIQIISYSEEMADILSEFIGIESAEETKISAKIQGLKEET